MSEFVINRDIFSKLGWENTQKAENINSEGEKLPENLIPIFICSSCKIINKFDWPFCFGL